MTNHTVFVLVTDSAYLYKAKKTIIDLRSIGQWHGDLVLINLEMSSINPTFLNYYKITEKRFPELEQKDQLLNILEYRPYPDTIDGREIRLPNQWEKLHVMDPFFKKWERVVFLDAGMRILYSVHESILTLDFKGKFLAPDDGGNYSPTIPNPAKLFESQISRSYPLSTEAVRRDFPAVNDLKEAYFLNCIWVYDTNILDICKKSEMLEGMIAYPICKTNEMALMNLYIHFKYGLWERFPKYASNGKILFDWCERNNPEPSDWRDYCFLKYPTTITFEDT
jgi:hypothetical protein